MAKKQVRDRRKLRPKKQPDKRAAGGDYALSELLKGDLDGRYAIAKAQKQLEADLNEYAGGFEKLTPPIIILIKKIVHKTLVTQQREKLALLGEAPLDNHYLALSNSLRLDVMALENLLTNKDRGRGFDLKDYIETTGKEKK